MVLPFILKRRQFVIIPVYAITINKAQGQRQTFDPIGIDLKYKCLFTWTFVRGSITKQESSSNEAAHSRKFETETSS